MIFSTLFRYIFLDLVKVFLLTSGALAGIMSFGGLLRPLMQQGLTIDQIGSMLSYSMPAMTAYSLPIAALFATTVVYGRLSADNEVTACRAAGLSYMWMTLPALIFGLLIAALSLVTLCFIVPGLMYKTEQVLFSNVAQIIASQIERSKQIRFDQGGSPVTVFAQGAVVEPPMENLPGTRAVKLIAPMILTYEPLPKLRNDAPRPDNPVRTPKDFYLARSATVFINQSPEFDNLSAYVTMQDGTKFPRSYTGAQQASIGATQFGPMTYESMVKENTKFMDVWRVRDLLAEPSASKRVSRVLSDFTRLDQQTTFMRALEKALSSPSKSAALEAADGRYVLTAGKGPVVVDNGELRLFSEPTDANDYSVQMRQYRDGVEVLTAASRELRVKASPDDAQRRMTVTVEMYDTTLKTPGGEPSERKNFPRTFSVQMSEDLLSVGRRPASYYIQGNNGDPEQRLKIHRELLKLGNMLWSEIHARLSFAVSCVILVLVGCALGLMFKSGNFLSAFSLSVVPALVSIALIITGQQTAENIPSHISASFHNPLSLGLALIWSGNVAVMTIATGLLGYLYRR